MVQHTQYCFSALQSCLQLSEEQQSTQLRLLPLKFVCVLETTLLCSKTVLRTVNHCLLPQFQVYFVDFLQVSVPSSLKTLKFYFVGIYLIDYTISSCARGCSENILPWTQHVDHFMDHIEMITSPVFYSNINLKCRITFPYKNNGVGY